MKKIRLILVAALSLSLVAGLLVLTACNGGTTIAALVNGEQILEQDVTDTIESMRAYNEEYQDPTAWAQALAASGLTPESLRESVIEGMARDIIVAQEASSQGITIDAEAIDEQIAQTRQTVGAADDDEWLSALQQYGFKDEAAYRKMLENNFLSNQLYEGFEVTPTDDELKEFIAQNPTAVAGYDARTGISTADGAAATDVVPAEDAVPEEGAEEGGEVYDIVNDVIPGLEEPAMMDAADVNLATIPADVLDQFKKMGSDSNKGLAFQEWISDLVDSAEILINDMPESVPYNVDMSLADNTESINDMDDVYTPEDQSSAEAVTAAIAEGLVITDATVGDGDEAHSGDTIRVHYVGTLEDGTQFDSNQEGDTPFEFTLGTGSVIRGWDAGVVGMRVGGVRNLVIPSSLAYGGSGSGSIPPDSTLLFEVQLVEIVGHNH